MSIVTILLIVLIVIALGGSGYGWRTGWGGPVYAGGMSIVGVILIVVLVLLLIGRA